MNNGQFWNGFADIFAEAQVRSTLKAVLLGCVLFASTAFGQAQQPVQAAQPAAQPAQAAPPTAQPAQAAPPTAQPAQAAQPAVTDAEAEVVSESALEFEVVEDDDDDEVEQTADSTALAADESEPAQEAAERPRTMLGVLRLESSTGHLKEAIEMTALMIKRLEELGIYELYGPDDIEKALADSRVRVDNCRDPRCVHGVGKALGVRRMISGTFDVNGPRSAVMLVLLNVASGKPIETVSIEGAPGVPAKDVLMTALERIHGQKEARPSVSAYYGPELSNLSEFLWSSIAVQGVGAFYSFINYGAGSNKTEADIVVVGGPGGGGTLSGIPSGANQIPIFARPAALANAYTAVSDDAYGVLYNPAGMPWVEGREAVVGYQYRFGMDIMAVSYANRALRDLGFGQAILLTTDRDGAMTEMLFVTATGYKINQDYLFGPLSVGAALKLMSNTVNRLSPDSPYGQSYGVGLDLGFMWELSSSIRYGLLFRDVPAVNKWKNRATGERYSESQPPTLHMGGSYAASYSVFMTADGQIPLYADQPWVMAGGIEYEFFRMLALRIGLQREILDEESNWWKITCGAGLKFGTVSTWGRDITLDLSYEYNTLELFPVVNVSVKAGF